MSKFGTITVSNAQLAAAAKSFAKHLGEHSASKSERFAAERVLRASGHNRVDYVEIPMDSPLIDHLLYEKDGKLMQPAPQRR